MYNLLQLVYFLKNAPYLRVIMPLRFQDVKSFELMIKDGIPEVYIIIPNADGLVIHLNKIQFRSHIEKITDLFSIGNPGNAIELKQDNIYLEANGTQILDNNGILLFKKDVERFLIEEVSDVLIERVFDTVLEAALNIHFLSKQSVDNKKCGLNTTIDQLLNRPVLDTCKSCIDRMAGVVVNMPERKKSLLHRRRSFV